MRLPFREFGGEPRAGRRWRFNLQRAAVVPDAEDRLRPLAKVVSPPAPRPERAPKHAVEWATWNTPYGRIDRVDRLGWIVFE
jgi:hypothetical protein